MKQFFEIQEKLIVNSTEGAGNIVVYVLPDKAEKDELINIERLDQHTLESALDPDEISRVEFNPEYLCIIWKRPDNISFKEQLRFDVSSIGLFLKKDKLIIILADNTLPFASKEFLGVTSLNSVIIRFLLQTVHHFFGHLKVIKQITAELQSKLNLSMENIYLLQMFSLSESLIYYLNALEANASVLTKLRSNPERINFTKEEIEILDDVMIEQQQCCRQTSIYSSVLSGLMDARGNIINNNMNILLRNLTLINVVFLPLNLIAGIGGMSEYTRMTEGVIDWKIAYSLFLIGMIVMGILTWTVIVRQIQKQKVIKNHTK